MRLPLMQFTIGRFMAAVVIAAGIAACARVPILGKLMAAMVPAFVLTALAFSSVLLLARPGRRIASATWLAASWPLSIPISLHAGWAAAYVSLGHPLGPSDNGYWIGLLEASVFFFMLSSVISTVAALILATMRASRTIIEAIIRVLILETIVWSSVIMIWKWDPVMAAWWFID